jgi:hypothetical protein
VDKDAFYQSAGQFIVARYTDRVGRPPDGVPADGNLFDLGLVDSYSMLQLIGHVEEISGREIDILTFDISQLFTLRQIYDVAFGAV